MWYEKKKDVKFDSILFKMLRINRDQANFKSIRSSSLIISLYMRVVTWMTDICVHLTTYTLTDEGAH